MSHSPDAPLRGELDRPFHVDTRDMEWTTSPGAGVLRKRLHRVGPAEAGQVTSVVRYVAGAKFPAHDHPEGEEILVLEGVFSDEHGDWPAGTYLLNPEGFRHAPFSREGCTLLVKLRQASEPSRVHVAVQSNELPWDATPLPGVERKSLYDQPPVEEITSLERWAAGTRFEARPFVRGAEIFVVEGSFVDESGIHEAGSWLRLPVASTFRADSALGCTIYLKDGGVASLRGGSPT